MWREPGFALPAVATFALGIGAATAIFSVAYGVAFRPLPYPRAERIVRLYEANASTREVRHLVSQGTFQGWRESVSALEHVALYRRANVRYTAGESPLPVTVMAVSPRFFDVLGVAPIRGRAFKPESQYTRFTTRELVISHDAWFRLFGGETDAVGRTFFLNDDAAPLTIVGVMPPGFTFAGAVDAWQPYIVELPVARVVRSWRYDSAVGRLAPGRTIEELRAELDVSSARLAREFPATSAGWTATVEPLQEAIAGRIGRASWLFLAAVAAVLLVACANVAGLLTGRAVGRARETSIRLALGAGRRQIARLWFGEAFAVAAAGATLGIAMAWALVRLLRAAAPPGLPRVDEIAIDLPALTVACAATVGSAIVCAMVPVVGRGDRALRDGLSSGSTSAGDTPARRRVSAALVALQCCAAVGLVSLAAVFGRSFLNLTSLDLGWRPEPVLSLHAVPRWTVPDRRPWFLFAQWSERLVARLEAMPDVDRAAVTNAIPFSPDVMTAEIGRGPERRTDEPRWPIGLHVVTEGYFDTMGLTLRRGRLFTRDDRFGEAVLNGRTDTPQGVAVVSESVARTLWPGQDALGQPFRIPGNDRSPFREVVGVVADVQYNAVGEHATLEVFVPWHQGPSGRSRVVVRARAHPADIAAGVQAAIVAEHGPTGIDRVVPIGTLVDRATAPARITSQLLAALGFLTLIMAAVGVYGSLSMLVRTRARELAVRLALGAPQRHVWWRTLVQGMTPAALGTAAGIGLAVLLVSSARSLLFGITGVDPGALASAAAVVLAMTITACAGPALRAARTDVLSVLRAD